MVRKKIMRLFLLVLFLGYYSSITLFTHTHIVSGVAIVHSHLSNPFSSKKTDNQQHSKDGFVLLQLLSHFSSTTPLSDFSIEVAQTELCCQLIQIEAEQLYNRIQQYANGLRGPPIKQS